ncbi:MAG: hypothetical protein IT210_26160 [Armatimonadetes bacterium]|nr:hypothetical protein [Armatimonadota bacterium]
MTAITYRLLTALQDVPGADRVVSALLDRGLKVAAASQSLPYLLDYPMAGLRCRIGAEPLRGAAHGPVETEHLGKEDRPLLRRETGTLYTLTCDAPPGREMDGVLFAVAVCDALIGEVGGIVLDPASQTAWGRKDWQAHVSWTAFRVSDHIRIHSIQDPERGSFWMHTHGLSKFGRPELELMTVRPGHATAGGVLLHHIAEFMAEGADIRNASTLDIGYGTVAFMDAGAFLTLFSLDFPTERERAGHSEESLAAIDTEAEGPDENGSIDSLLARIEAEIERGEAQKGHER